MRSEFRSKLAVSYSLVINIHVATLLASQRHLSAKFNEPDNMFQTDCSGQGTIRVRGEG